VNITSVELDDVLGEAGFAHAAATVGARLGAVRIGASVYRAEAGRPIWPYHYHHGIEEWLYVIAGAPVLREPAGERTLAAGDLVCFPSGRLGAHTLKGPGRFVILATGQHVEPWMSVYPDSDKISGPEGILLRSSAVGYWHGEGTAGAQEPDRVVRDTGSASPRAGVHLRALPTEEAGAQDRTARIGTFVGAERLDATVLDLNPGEASEPYHYVHGREDWLLVLAGAPALRHPHGEEQLDTGDLVCLPDGPAGARRLLNRGSAPARVLVLSTTGLPVNVCYPETGHWLMRNGPGPDETVRLTPARAE
jgi:uncharacterized cupin superfamily protein